VVVGQAGVSTDFGRRTLPYCSFVGPGEKRPRVGVGVGTDVLDLTAAAAHVVPDRAALFADGTLDALLATDASVWAEVRTALLAWVDAPGAERHLVAVDDVELVLPFTVADYVDFYASEHHALNVGRIFRPGGEALSPAWKHLPIGYHGRAGTVVVSGTPVRRPSGLRATATGAVTFGPTAKLDLEAEVGFVLGSPTRPGGAVGVDDVEHHLFGVCVLNDWSARDVQAFEYVPLGPFLGKSFATSVSAWVVPLAALDEARTAPPAQDPVPADYLRAEAPWTLDVDLTVTLDGTVVSRPPFATTYWTPAQMLAHLTVNGASLRAGDLFASGTVSGPDAEQLGSLLELHHDTTYLADGATVTIAAAARLSDGRRLELGDVTGTITPATTH
jgi:fumarylacetoacetase